MNVGLHGQTEAVFWFGVADRVEVRRGVGAESGRQTGGWMDRWILFRPEAPSLKGLGTLNTYTSDRFPIISHKPLELPFT